MRAVYTGPAAHMVGMNGTKPDQDTPDGRTAAYRWLIAHGIPTDRGPVHERLSYPEWQDHIAVCGIAEEVLRDWPDTDVEHSGGGWSGCPGIGVVTFGAFICCRCGRPGYVVDREFATVADMVEALFAPQG